MHRAPVLYCFILLFCSGAASAVPPKGKFNEIPAEAFFEPVRDSGFTFSPDGNHLAYITREDDVYSLAITDLNEIKIIGTHLLSPYPVHRLVWLNNNRILYECIGEIRAINIDGTGHKSLISYDYEADSIKNAVDFYKSLRKWNVIGVVEGGEEILVSSQDLEGYMNIHRINIHTGNKVDIVNGKELGIHEWFTDMSGRVRIGVRNEKGGSELFSLIADKEKPALVPLVLGKGKYTFTLDSKSLYAQRAQIAGFAPDGNYLYLCENMNSDTFRLVGFDLRQDKIVMEIAADPKYDVCGPGISMEPLFYDHNTRLAGIRYERDKSHTLLFDDKFKAIQTALDKKYKDRINNPLTWTSNLDKVLFHSYSEKNNGRIYIYYPKEKRFALQSYGSLELENFRSESSTKTIEYKTRDNHAIEAYLTVPPNPENNRLPLIVMPHVSPFFRDTWSYNSYAHFFASRGNAVLQPNYRGSVGYGRNHLNPELKELTTLMTDDIADGVKDLIKSGVADENRIYIFGQSYGGYAAIMSTIRYPDLYRAAVSAFAPLNLVTQIKNHKESKQYSALDFWRGLAGNPKEISPYHRIREIKVPLFIFYGSEDPIVSVQQVYDFEKVKDKAPAEIQTMVFKKEGHGLALPGNNIYFVNKTLEHFRKNQGPRALNVD
jgi:dipeptidyl aminopeptidase/acylaminoacyl peptidase